MEPKTITRAGITVDSNSCAAYQLLALDVLGVDLSEEKENYLTSETNPVKIIIHYFDLLDQYTSQEIRGAALENLGHLAKQAVWATIHSERQLPDIRDELREPVEYLVKKICDKSSDIVYEFQMKSEHPVMELASKNGTNGHTRFLEGTELRKVATTTLAKASHTKIKGKD